MNLDNIYQFEIKQKVERSSERYVFLFNLGKKIVNFSIWKTVLKGDDFIRKYLHL